MNLHEEKKKAARAELVTLAETDKEAAEKLAATKNFQANVVMLPLDPPQSITLGMAVPRWKVHLLLLSSLQNMLDESEAPMKQISNKEYEKYQQYQTDKLHGRILTPDGLRIICAGLDNDPEKIGKHMLEMLAKFRNEGIVE